MSTAILAMISVAVICLVLGVIIGVVGKIFAVEINPLIETTEELLPGANCGGCGYAGCSDFAKALVAKEAEPAQCPVCSDKDLQSISSNLGITSEEKEKMVAIVLCGGNNKTATSTIQYNGIIDCKAAASVAGGYKGCAYGCLGMASCARACPFGAIEMKDGLAIVHPDLCVGCGKCVETCPRNLIKMVPAKAEVHVFCSSPEKGAAKKKVCSVSCIGCRKCVKASEEGQISMNKFVAVVNYEYYPAPEVIEAAACPTNCIRKSQ